MSWAKPFALINIVGEFHPYQVFNPSYFAVIVLAFWPVSKDAVDVI